MRELLLLNMDVCLDSIHISTIPGTPVHTDLQCFTDVLQDPTLLCWPEVTGRSGSLKGNR